MKTLSGHEDVTDFALDVLGAEFGEQNIIEVTSDDVPQRDSGPSPGNRAACGHPVTLSVVAAGWLTELLHQDHVMIIGAIDACCDLGPASGSHGWRASRARPSPSATSAPYWHHWAFGTPCFQTFTSCLWIDYI